MDKSNLNRADYKIIGMDCAEEVTALKGELSPLAGVRELSFDILNGKMTVVFDQTIAEPAILSAVERAGLKAEPWTKAKSAPPTTWITPQLIVMSLSGLFLIGGMLVHALLNGWRAAIGVEETGIDGVSRLLYFTSIVAGGWFVFPKAGQSLSRLRLDMNVLMTIAVGGAVMIGQIPEAATVAFLFSLSLWLEAWSVGRARKAIGALMALSPDRARVLSATGAVESVDAKSVSLGTRVLVNPGDRFPLDGTIAVGETSVNQAPITGESMPVEKRPGDAVFAGTINEGGAVEIITTRRADDSAIARIIDLVADAQQRKSESEQWVERFARYYTPAVLILAMAIVFVPPTLGLGTWEEWFYKGLVLLVIACPCALVISTPVSIVAALASAAHRGILIKGGRFIEIPGQLRAIAFDKTGTMTVGRPAVKEIIPTAHHTADEVLATAAALESRSEHPLAKAILQAASTRGVSFSPAEDVKTIKGKGITAAVNGGMTWLGSHRLLEERSQETPDLHQTAERLAATGTSVIVVGKADHVCGMISVADPLRKEAKDVVRLLHEKGVKSLILLTGDNEPTAEVIAAEAGLDEVRAELLPEDKLSALEGLLAKYETVAMIGDGVNDAPALARATLGIAMGAMGSDAAIEAADIALMADDLTAIPWLVDHSRRTMRIIRQNVFFSLAVKLLFVVLTFGGLASLWGAIAADTGASLLVIANGLRLLRGVK